MMLSVFCPSPAFLCVGSSRKSSNDFRITWRWSNNFFSSPIRFECREGKKPYGWSCFFEQVLVHRIDDVFAFSGSLSLFFFKIKVKFSQKLRWYEFSRFYIVRCALKAEMQTLEISTHPALLVRLNSDAARYLGWANSNAFQMRVYWFWKFSIFHKPSSNGMFLDVRAWRFGFKNERKQLFIIFSMKTKFPDEVKSVSCVVNNSFPVFNYKMAATFSLFMKLLQLLYTHSKVIFRV